MMRIGEIWAPTSIRIKESSGWMSVSSSMQESTPENSVWREPEGNIMILELMDDWVGLPNMKYFVAFEYLDKEKDGEGRYVTPREDFLRDYYKVYNENWG